MSFLPAIVDASAFGWVKKHPVAVTFAAAAAAAVSLAQFAYNEQLSERNKLIGSLSTGSRDDMEDLEDEIDRTVSWSDHKGGKLETVVDDGYNTSYLSPQITECKVGEIGDHFCIDGSPPREGESDDDDDSDSEVPIGAKSPVSPQWGWYVSITPPQSAYPNPEHNGPNTELEFAES